MNVTIPKKIAIYGKGGIGKSTTSANITYILGGRGHKVVQIGCDPKHDSTKLLLPKHGQVTVLDYIRNVPPSKRKIEDFAITGANDVLCIEAGGPEPGIGCAGRGILTTFDILKAMGIDDLPKDFTVFDVLGDVVCGGFAVPMRQEYADAIYVVTSGEYMAIYAANNILKGLLNFGNKPRAAGIILNCRGVRNEVETVTKFADAVGVPIVAVIPRDPVFQEAERLGATVCASFPDSEPVLCYSKIADDIEAIASEKRELYLPKPLGEQELEELIFGNSVSVSSSKTQNCCDKPRTTGRASCASRGAVYAAGRVTDLAIIVHGPPNCGYVMSHTQDSHYLSDVSTNPVLETVLRNNIVCTDMSDQDFIFGGHQKLIQTLESEIFKGRKQIMIVTTCVSGMIGDNVKKIVDQTMDRYPDVNIVSIAADGNLSGYSNEGIEQVQDYLVGLIDVDIPQTEDAINLVDSTFMQFNRGRNQLWLKRLLEPTGLRIGCKIFEDCTLDDIRTCRRNKYMMLTGDQTAHLPLRRKLEKKGFTFMDRTLPSGYSDTLSWLDYLSDRTGHRDECTRMADTVRKEYAEALERFSPYLRGKRAFVVASSYFNIDWLIELALDSGMIIEKVCPFGIGTISSPFYTKYADSIDIVEGLRISEITELARSVQPDIVIGSHHAAADSGFRYANYPQECLTHYASISYLEYLSNTLRSPDSYGWKNWRD